MTNETNNFAPQAFYSGFADRCGEFGIPLFQLEQDGSVSYASGDWDENLVQFILSSDHFARVRDRIGRGEDGETFSLELRPGLHATLVVCAPRKTVRAGLLCCFLDHQIDERISDPDWQQADEGMLTGFRQYLQEHPDQRTHPMERERFDSILRWWYLDLCQYHEHMDELGNLSLELGDSYEVISLLLRIGDKMNVAQEPIDFVQSVCSELREVIAFRWVGARLLPGVLEGKVLAGGLISEGESELDRRDLLQQTTELLITREYDGTAVLDTTTEPALREYEQLGRKILAHPLERGGRIVGGVFACDKIDEDDTIDWGDIKMVEAAASHLQIFLDNAALYEDIRLMFIGTLDALTASIDAKDPYTCGHSRRVAHMSRELAAAMGLDAKVVDRIHIAGLVHDVGKIGVPEAILRKPGRLTDDEFAVIKRHPDIGARILRDIPHFEDVLPGVLYHHERFDGRGYPRGLAGEDIPLFGRIIAIADSFDAMSSTRQYRKAMPRSKVLEEVRTGAGTQFDPNLVPIFLRLDYSEYDRLAEEHQATADITAKEAA